jgi:hypothetical protein
MIPYSGDTRWCDDLKDPSFTPEELRDLRGRLIESLNESHYENEPHAPTAIREKATKLLCVNDEIAGV